MSHPVRFGFATMSLVAVGGVMLSVAVAEPPASSDSSPSSVEPSVQPLSPELARLELFVGPWRVVERHYDEVGKEVAVVKGTEEIIWILDRHAIRRTYTSSTESSVFRAIGLLTFNEATKKYQGIWLDNRSSAGPMTVSGEWSEKTKTMVLTLESSDKDGNRLRHKVVEKFLDEKRREAVTYLLRDGQVIKRMDVQYERAIPCPNRLRPVLDELTRG